MTHPAVQHYQQNKEQLDTDYFIEFVKSNAERNPSLAKVINTTEYLNFIALQTNPSPFDELLKALPELSLEDLEWLETNMPQSLVRLRVMKRIVNA